MADATVIPIRHRALGDMLRMNLAPGLSFDLTLEEARTLSRALAAVSRDRGAADELYLSPLASDHDLSARPTDAGVQITAASGVCNLSWPAVASLAERLAIE
ncbi:hypothetical protein [Methylocapsa palsarum]|uniref:Uncharacterized protein n=1 Tax=Methylocapsa palsarum TaxID=1612308 RepID=A0A1I4AY70_9HYPH|nr:hypothetical protein [Methylocapsa palsarum]SFK60811.1 hypothetical protein SAMN05444581_1128 [Methylocapsa palsarum]